MYENTAASNSCSIARDRHIVGNVRQGTHVRWCTDSEPSKRQYRGGLRRESDDFAALNRVH